MAMFCRMCAFIVHFLKCLWNIFLNIFRFKEGTSLRSRCQQCEQHEREYRQRLNEIEIFYTNKLHEEISLQKTAGVRSSCQQCEQHEYEQKQRMDEKETIYKHKLHEVTLQKTAGVRSSCQQCEQHEYQQKQRLDKMERLYKRKLDEIMATLKQREEELKAIKNSLQKTAGIRSSCQQCEQHENEQKQRLDKMETLYKRKLDDVTSAMKHKDKERKALEIRLMELQRIHNEELTEARSALQQKEEELKSFKDRMAEDVAVSIRTGDTESLNSPVSKSRLTEMYQKLKLLQWPKVKDRLKSNNMNPVFTKALIQKMFEDASKEMRRNKEQIEQVFGLIEFSSRPSLQKVKNFKQLAIQNFQLSVYRSSKEHLLKSLLPELEGQYSQDMLATLRLLASECYWLGCLMALNNPPFQPDWQNQIPGMDPWDIFP